MGCPRIYGQTQAFAQNLVVQSDSKHNSPSFTLRVGLTLVRRFGRDALEENDGSARNPVTIKR
jgi:hypothetical protein